MHLIEGGGSLAAALAAAVLLATAGNAAAAQVTSLYDPGHSAAFAFVDVRAPVRSAPERSANVIGRLSLRTIDGTSNVVGVLASTSDGWLEVSLSALPNGKTGWVPAGALGAVQTTSSWLQIDTERLRLTLVRAGRVMFSAPIGVGKASTPTPHGNFYVIDRLEGFAPGGLYGPLAFGTSARSPVLTDWPGGGVVGIHGTNEPRLVPGHPSHGCIRLRNRDIRRLGRLLEVGTPISIT